MSIRGSRAGGSPDVDDERIEHLAGQDPRVPRLRSVPCVGPVTATAFLAALDDVLAAVGRSSLDWPPIQ